MADRLRVVVWGLVFVVLLAVQVDALYTPQVDAPLPFAGADKLVHAALFGAPMLAGALAGIPPRLLAGLLVAHAAVSEVIQGVVLPHRSGDPLDAVADTLGVLLAVVVVRALRR